MSGTPKKHSLGWSIGAIYEHDDGTVSFHQSGHFVEDFRVRIADVVGFTETKGGKKAFEWTMHILGRGGEIATASVKAGDTRKVEEWFRAHPDFGGNQQPATSGGPSVADEIAKLASLRDDGVLSEAEFSAAKARLLGGT